MLMSCASLHHTRNPKIDMLKLAGRRPAMNQTHCAAMLKQNKICVLPSRAAISGARHAEHDVFGIAGRRPAMKRTRCSATSRSLDPTLLSIAS